VNRLAWHSRRPIQLLIDIVMNVKVEVELCDHPGKKDKEQMYEAAENLTNDIKSIVVSEPKRKGNILIAEFTINDAKQIDVVDKIGDKFSDIMENYDASSINFPKRRTTTRKSQPIEKHTRSKVNT
jgi:hypothetical protein